MASLPHMRWPKSRLSAERPRPGVSLLLPHPVPDGERRRAARVGAQVRRAMAVIGQQARADGASLVPLRLFIGLGWLRTWLEKAIDPAWRDGSGLVDFLQGQLISGAVAFPFYESLIRRCFLPHATGLGLAIVVGELLVGLAIVTGCCTRAALWGGLFMSLNFLLAGVPNPSAFYIAIQATLLLANAGAILGLDGLRGDKPAPRPRARRLTSGATAPLALLTAVYAGAHVTDASPAGSVRDPAMILAVLATMALLWSLFVLLRREEPRGV